MKILIAPDSFKGSLSAIKVANSIEKGILRAVPTAEIFKIPMADGGEGTIEAILAAKGGTKQKVEVHNPIRRKIQANYAILTNENTAIIEMAMASGLPLLSQEERNPLKTSTFGTGELIKKAIENLSGDTLKKIIVCIGGSATNDGGAGMLQALGVKFLDKFGKEINVCGGNLKEIKKIITIEKLDRCEIVVACDVENPLLGEFGASAIFSPQKGATPDIVKILEENLTHFADVVETTFPHLQGLRNQKGTGAAGGLGYGLMAFLDAKMQKGVEMVLEITDLENILKDFSAQNRDLVITGEGAIDYQTAFGKVPLGVAKAAKKHFINVIGIAGTLGRDYQILYNQGFDSLFSITDKPMTLQEAIDNAETLLESIAERVIRLYAKA